MRGLKGPGGAASKGLASAERIWAETVGPETAARTRVTGLGQGVLRVDVASAALKHHLGTFRREELVAELSRRLPEARIREIRYRVGTPR